VANQCVQAARLTVLCVTSLLGGAQSGEAQEFKHVRSDESAVRRMLDAGYQRSATFRLLVDRLESTSCIVYIATAAKLSQGMEGALLHTVKGRPDLPILRVVIKASLAAIARLRSSATSFNMSSKPLPET
jgi:hypothetical protein